MINCLFPVEPEVINILFVIHLFSTFGAEVHWGDIYLRLHGRLFTSFSVREATNCRMLLRGMSWPVSYQLEIRFCNPSVQHLRR